jgi:hypothetical protein
MILNGIEDMMKEGFATPDDWGPAAKHDPEMAKFMQFISTPEMEGKVPFHNPNSSQEVNSYIQATFTSPKLFYSGVPIIVEGQTMGAFCLVGPEKPQNFDPREQMELAAQMTVVLEQHLQQKRFASAQVAMMQQMMMMQQQQMFMSQQGFGMPAMPGAQMGMMPMQGMGIAKIGPSQHLMMQQQMMGGVQSCGGMQQSSTSGQD